MARILYGLCPEGYVDLDKILQHQSIKGKYNVGDIERVVTSNDKQRFKLRLNVTTNRREIKAVQGHSIREVDDTGLVPILVPKYKTLVHGTFIKFWSQIKAHGLHCMTRNHIHLAKGISDHAVISGIRKHSELYIYINLEKALHDGIKFFEADNGVVLTSGNVNGYLEPKYFEKVILALTAIISLKMEAKGIPLSAFITPNQEALSPRTSASPRYKPRRRQFRNLNAAHYNFAPAESPQNMQQTPLSIGPQLVQNLLQCPQSVPHLAQNGYQMPNMSQVQHNWRSRNFVQKSRQNSSKQVLITGFAPYTQHNELAYTFLKYGNVKMELISNRLAKATFATEAEASKAVQDSGKLSVNGEFLTIKHYSEEEVLAEMKNKQKQPRRSFTKHNDVDIIKPQEIAISGDFNHQVEQILAAVRLTQQEVQTIMTLYTDLQETLQTLWPDCVARPFGSITTGLGTKSSDADCFIDLAIKYKNPSANNVQKAKRVLQNYPEKFSKILCIPRANTPIVKLLHIPTKTNCDVSFKTPLGVQNSSLVAFLLKSDERLVPLAVLIKYWAKIHELSGTGKLTNYALVWMIIFYLQQPPMSILPSVAWLQRDAANDVIIDNWNTGFMDQLDQLPKSSNTSSLAELLGGFFEYYATFNFEDMIVCPYLGTPVKKDQFKDLEHMSEEFSRYKDNLMSHESLPLKVTSPMVVQDPLEQSHNVATTVTARLAQDIRQFFVFAANAYEQDKLKQCEQFLKVILLQKPLLKSRKKLTECKLVFMSKVLSSIAEEDWQTVVEDAVFTVLEGILMANVQKVVEKVDENNKKPQDTASVKSEGNKRKVKYVGTINKAVLKRKKFKVCYNMNMKFIEREKRITQELIGVDKECTNIQFQMTMVYAKRPKNVAISFKLVDGELEAFREFGRFVASHYTWFAYLFSVNKRELEDTISAAQTRTEVNLDSLAERVADLDSDDDDEPEHNVVIEV